MWEVEWKNDTGPEDDYYCEWWVISNGIIDYSCDDKIGADWLCCVLNKLVKDGKND